VKKMSLSKPLAQEKIVMNFSMPFRANKLYEFIILPANMSLYEGKFLIPGIKNVVSSDPMRKVGTVDKVYNTDGSSHQTLTKTLIPGDKYSLLLDHITMSGYKKCLATPITSFVEEWSFHQGNGDECQIQRSLLINYQTGFFNHLFIKYFIIPQLTASFKKHHSNLIRSKLVSGLPSNV
jgi:hypothetical protein